MLGSVKGKSILHLQYHFEQDTISSQHCPTQEAFQFKTVAQKHSQLKCSSRSRPRDTIEEYFICLFQERTTPIEIKNVI